MNDELWINKYKPCSLNEIIGNKKQIEKIKDWLKNIKTSPYSAIIITGFQGIGKTQIIKLILEEFNYIVRIINPSEIKDHRILDDFNDYYNYNNSIYTKVNFSQKNKNIALVFDETENITLTSEKKYVMEIYKENNKNKAFPLIFISNNQHSKLLNDLKKGCNEIIFDLPLQDELKLLIKKILINEKIKFESEDIYEKIINVSQYDIRRLINLLQELSYHMSNDNIITNDKINEFCFKTRDKNIDVGLFDSTKRILNKYLDYDTIMKLYESEKVLLPLMIHENYIKKILTKNKDSFNNVMDTLETISDSISQGDNIETSIYTDQNWYLQNIHGFYTCINTSYWINKKYNNDIDLESIKFSSDLNKTSLKNINRKNIANLQKIINNKSNQEILMLNYIANHLIKNNKEEDLIDILYTYSKEINIKDIELCLKIDKTNDFLILNTKEKKKLQKYLFTKYTN